MKASYDEERDAREGQTGSFTLAGHTFRTKPAMGAREVGILADHGAKIDATGALTAGYYDDVVAAIRATLLKDDRAAWDALMAADLDNPITLKQLTAIANDMIEETSARPPEQRSPSGSTGSEPSTRSTGGSGSPADRDLASLASGRG